ncbi:hypothetical protein KY285_026348 [Solanum tuberosum]|nr:hypothetical protein KY285_026348 [Solanum tuberosum]
MIQKNMHYLHTYTFEQRRQNWIIKNTSRPTGSIIDYVYHHLDTNKKFRSLVEVYHFVLHGEVREINKKLSKNEETVQVNLGNDAPVQSFSYLWDFKLIHVQERSKEVFPIPNIDELQGVDPSIDLLSSLPKASRKSPREEDKEKNKSKKRKNVMRDQEKEDILEAQRRSKVDEELRLDELRARAGGASSSSMPTEVGLISRFHVVMDSEALTTIPPAVEGAPELSLSGPSTTRITMDVSGEIEAHASYPDSEA